MRPGSCLTAKGVTAQKRLARYRRLAVVQRPHLPSLQRRPPIPPSITPAVVPRAHKPGQHPGRDRLGHELAGIGLIDCHVIRPRTAPEAGGSSPRRPLVRQDGPDGVEMC